MTTQNFIQAIPEDELTAFLRGVYLAAKESKSTIERLSGDVKSLHEYLMGTLVVIDMMNKIGNLGLEIPSVTGNTEQEIVDIKALIYKIENIATDGLSIYGTDDDKSLINRGYNDLGQYKFNENDFDRVQELINELRVIVTKATSVDADHKSRLLKRLEKLQSELHKHTSDFDKFWGLFGEVGPIIGKFGEDTKPFVDRVRELMDIVKRTQSSSNESLGKSETQEKLPKENNGEE